MSGASSKSASSMSLRWPALLDKAQAAEYLSVSERTINRLMADDTLRPVAVHGATLIRFRRVELDDYIQGLKHASDSASIGKRQLKKHSSEHDSDESKSSRSKKQRTEPASADAVAGSGAG